MKIISMLGHESKRIRADTRLTLRPCWQWSTRNSRRQDQIERLRADVNKLMEARDGTGFSVTLAWGDRVRLSKQGLEAFKNQNRWISAGWIGASAAARSAASPSAMRPMCFGTAGEARRSFSSKRFRDPRHRASDSDGPQATACSVGDIAAVASWLM